MAVPSIILRYDSSFYQSKIDAFENLNSRLKEHLDRLEELKRQIPDFWEDESTAKYIEAIAKNILYGGQHEIRVGWRGFLKRLLKFQ